MVLFHGHLIASLDAVSLAFFGFQFHHSKANLIARQKYPAALRSLNKALRSPETVKSDSTLLAVLLLDLFEKITNKDAGFSESWMSHIIGALALVKLRGSESLTSYIGTRLSVKLVTNLIISCVSASLEPPLELVKIRSDLESIVTTDGPKWRVTCLMIQYAGLRAAILRNALSDADVISEATRLDYEYEVLAQSMPPAWQYDRICLEGPSEKVLEQHFDVYPDHYICQVWNVLRLTRIMLNDLIRKYHDRVMSGNPKGYSYNHKADVATITIDAISLDICASVPQFTQAQLAESSDSLTPALQHARCYTVLFPLYAAGSFSSPSTKIRQWAIRQLEYFSTDFGIRNSGLVAEYLKTAPKTCPWTIYGMLGSYAFAA
ncbi:MAG: hypothetical protein M1822_006033 [Bathelium mastoideum]|nr:MAG: hypothetical protein M1822_006033 [Bathelium mastoideum]